MAMMGPYCHNSYLSTRWTAPTIANFVRELGYEALKLHS